MKATGPRPFIRITVAAKTDPWILSTARARTI